MKVEVEVEVEVAGCVLVVVVVRVVVGRADVVGEVAKVVTGGCGVSDEVRVGIEVLLVGGVSVCG